jgi:phospholipid transport system substrate-binding protein
MIKQWTEKAGCRKGEEMKSSLSISRLHRAARSGLAGAALAAVLAAASLPAVAADPVVDPTPDAMILSLSSEVLDAIRNDKAIQAGDFDRVQKLVNERILPRVDFDKMTRLAVGRAWRTASVEQREMLKAEFRLLLLRTYSGALSKVTDHKVRLRPSRGQDSPTDAVVRTQIVPSQGDPIDVDFRLNKADAGWKIYDVDIMGVWLAENYKNEFAEILNQGGIDALIKSLAEKNQKPAMAAKTA